MGIRRETMMSASTAPGPTEGQLIHIADQEDGSIIWNGSEELRHQDDIDHRDFIDDDEVSS